MARFRFPVGTNVMCNLGTKGWKLGKIIELNYREENWPSEKYAPYQVMLEEDHTLIYVPEDNQRFCKKATYRDLRIVRNIDTLKSFDNSHLIKKSASNENELNCSNEKSSKDIASFRKGKCQCCNECPENWTYAELYSEHYSCVARNGLKLTQFSVDLGKISVGEIVNFSSNEEIPTNEGFNQCPTLVRLPPGVNFFDDGSLTGVINFDPYREKEYRVEFVAVSTKEWNNNSIGIIRLEVSFNVVGNEPTKEFNIDQFTLEQVKARNYAEGITHNLKEIWNEWECGNVDNLETCKIMIKELDKLRKLLENHPRLDKGIWWSQLGGFHMNIHKLLENTLFECELYLGYALTFGDSEVRLIAEKNLEGCYQKRLLETARFMWIEGIKIMLDGKWIEAVEIFEQAASKKNGWGWAVNYGDIWISEAAARFVYSVEQIITNKLKHFDDKRWVGIIEKLLDKAQKRCQKSESFVPSGHPWALEIHQSLISFHSLKKNKRLINRWLDSFKSRTIYWCAQILGGAPPFPPKPKPRHENADDLICNLRSINLHQYNL